MGDRSALGWRQRSLGSWRMRCVAVRAAARVARMAQRTWCPATRPPRQNMQLLSERALCPAWLDRLRSTQTRQRRPLRWRGYEGTPWRLATAVRVRLAPASLHLPPTARRVAWLESPVWAMAAPQPWLATRCARCDGPRCPSPPMTQRRRRQHPTRAGTGAPPSTPGRNYEAAKGAALPGTRAAAAARPVSWIPSPHSQGGVDVPGSVANCACYGCGGRPCDRSATAAAGHHCFARRCLCPTRCWTGL